MGGEKAPIAPMEASFMASHNYGVQVRLFGVQKEILKRAQAIGPWVPGVTLQDVEHVISMDDSPILSLREKKDSSILRLCHALREKTVHVMVSAGNTGAVVAASVLVLGKLKGIRRPGLLGILPGIKGPVGLIDVGANVDSRPKDLLGFALMGSIFWRLYTGISEPTVGLLNIGEEKGKGNRLVKETVRRMDGLDVNFVGNVEGNEVLLNKADVVVCDGFVGNILLKALEGMGEFIFSSLAPGSNASDKWNLSWEEYGGAVLLGVNGLVVVCHGRSTSRALYKAIDFARRLVELKLLDSLNDELSSLN